MRVATYSGNQQMASGTALPTDPQPGQVQIEVAYVGLCGTDLHIWHGHMDHRVDIPHILGHEMSGTVSAVGEGVNGWSAGDPVTVMPLDWDGSCPACVAGHKHICQNLDFIGIDSPGALQQFWNVPASTLVALPPGLSLRDAALVEPVAVAVHDVRRSELSAGDRAVVIGGGPIGLLIACVAREVGAEVLVSEIDSDRRSTLGQIGLDAVDPAATDIVEHVERWTDGAGADVVFEVSGAAPAVLQATSVAKVRGTVVIVAIHPEPRPVDLQRMFWRELRMLGARVYEREDFEAAVEHLAAGQIPSDTVISLIEPLDRIQHSMERLENGEAMKILINVGEAGADHA